MPTFRIFCNELSQFQIVTADDAPTTCGPNDEFTVNERLTTIVRKTDANNVDTSANQTLTNKDMTDSSNRITACKLRTGDGNELDISATTPTVGQALVATSATAASWDDVAENNRQHTVIAVKTVSQAVPGSTFGEYIIWESTTLDLSGIYDNTTGMTTIAKAGVYLVEVNVTLTPVVIGGTRLSVIRERAAANEVQSCHIIRAQDYGFGGQMTSTSTLVDCIVGDIIKVEAFCAGPQTIREDGTKGVDPGTCTRLALRRLGN